MNFTPNYNLFFVALDQVPNAKLLTIVGYSPNVGAAANDWNIWELNSAWNRLNVATSMEILSDSTSDTSAGIGAKSVLIQGLDGSFNQISEVVTLSGTIAIQLVNKYLTINTLTVLTAGTTGFNVGNITVRIAGGGATEAYIAIEASASRMGRFTVPSGYTFVLTDIFALANKAGGITATATIALATITATSVVIDGLPVIINSGNSIVFNGSGPAAVIPQMSTFEFILESVSVGGTNISTAFIGVLTKN